MAISKFFPGLHPGSPLKREGDGEGSEERGERQKVGSSFAQGRGKKSRRHVEHHFIAVSPWLL
jgi:hypothetical protein